jgi:putative transposase
MEQASRIVAAGVEDARFAALRKSETVGRPVGNDDFIREAEKQTGRKLKPGKRGPKPKATREDEG